MPIVVPKQAKKQSAKRNWATVFIRMSTLVKLRRLATQTNRSQAALVEWLITNATAGK